MNKWIRYFSWQEYALWLGSASVILIFFFLFDGENLLTLAASLIGVTSLIFNAKGHPAGQVLMIVFSLLYGVISYGFRYWGEMITYLGMTLPMAAAALISWLRHPYQGRKSQVAVNRIGGGEWIFSLLLTAAVTGIFYFILRFFDTPNLFFSTLSIATSFLAAYLTFRRSPYFALSYAANDGVLIILWLMAARAYAAYYSVVICFAAFLLNDLYGFFSWRLMEGQQA
ncbi:MAG: nicotinamide mononucleotide transporter [Clostridia bacterium]|nr:nicotinamide mononucleotide transporter [Clostridia bacterium]